MTAHTPYIEQRCFIINIEMNWKQKIKLKLFSLPASARYQLPMFVVLFHLCFDQISHELCKGRFWISFIPFPSSSKTNVSTVFSNELLLYPGVRLELVPEGGDNPGEGMPADHEGGRVLELPQVGQSTCP